MDLAWCNSIGLQLKEAVFGTESDVAMLAKATTNLAIASAFSDEEQHAQAMRHAQAARQIIEESILPENQVLRRFISRPEVFGDHLFTVNDCNGPL